MFSSIAISLQDGNQLIHSTRLLLRRRPKNVITSMARYSNLYQSLIAFWTKRGLGPQRGGVNRDGRFVVGFFLNRLTMNRFKFEMAEHLDGYLQIQ